MKKLLLLTLLTLSFSSQAATHYRDRIAPVPAGVCLVEFNGNTINAILIQEVETGMIGFYERNGKTGTFETKVDEVQRPAIMVRLVNGAKYWKKTETVAEAEMLKVGFLKQIKTECGT